MANTSFMVLPNWFCTVWWWWLWWLVGVLVHSVDVLVVVVVVTEVGLVGADEVKQKGGNG